MTEGPLESAPPAPLAPRAPLLSVFRHRNYRLFFAGQLLSLMGGWMQTVAQAWLVYRLTGSPWDLGFIVFLNQSPVFFLTAVGGTIADRFEKRRLLMACLGVLMALSAALAALTFSGLVEVWMIASIALAAGVVNALEIPTRQSFTVEMVGKSDLQPAVALNGVLFNLARIVGPTAAGAVIAAAGEAWCFAVNAASYSFVLAALALMRLAPRTPRPLARPWDELKAGFAYVMADSRIKAALAALAVSSFAGGPYLTLMPVYAEQVLGAGAQGYGLLMTMVGAGAVFGALTVNRVRGEWLERAPFLAAIGFGIGVTALSVVDVFWLAVATVPPTAFMLMLQGNSTNVLIQTRVADEVRGRVTAYYTMAFLGVMPFGSLAAGAIAHEIGVARMLTIGGLVCLVGALASWTLRARRARRP